MVRTTTNIRMDSDLKVQADVLFAELGMNISTAFNIFVRHAFREGGPLFTVKLGQPNKERLLRCSKQKGLQKPRLLKVTMT